MPLLQSRGPVLDRIAGPMSAGILSSIGLGFATVTGREHFPPVPGLDQFRVPNWVTVSAVAAISRESAASDDKLKQTPGRC